MFAGSVSLRERRYPLNFGSSCSLQQQMLLGELLVQHLLLHHILLLLLLLQLLLLREAAMPASCSSTPSVFTRTHCGPIRTI